MIIDDLSDAPDPVLDPPKTFSFKAAAMVLSLKKMVTQLKAALTELGAWLAGGAYAIPFVVDTTVTGNFDPGAGVLHFNNATQQSATYVYVDVLSSAGANVQSLLTAFGASTSAVKGSLKFQKQGDLSKWIVFDVVGVTLLSGYVAIGIANGAGSSTSPFANGESVTMQFQRTGDKGDQGVAPITHVREEQALAGQAAAPTLISTGIYQRTLNTVKSNDISGVSLASNRVTLPAGKYHLRASAPLTVQATAGSYARHKTAIYNVTDSAYVAMGAGVGDTNVGTASSSLILPISQAECVITLASAKVFEIRSAFDGSFLAGGGPTVGAGTGVVAPEVYTEFIIEKL
jgi:hypothetical protein